MPSAAGDTRASASKLAQNESLFLQWAQFAQLDLPIRNGSLPTVLDNLITESKKIPKWVANPDSPRYKYSNPKLRPGIKQLNHAFPLDYNTFSEDAELSDDVSYVIDAILRVSKRCWDLSVHLPTPTEGDRRSPLDHLMSCTWDDEKTESFQHREEAPLQLLDTSPSTTFPTKVLPDSSVFIKLADWHLPLQFPAFSNGCSALLRESTNDGHLRALHWVSEYKKDKKSYDVALRQAMIAATPGLYQRRALGFQSHFIFMTVHRPPNYLDVYAATWGPTQVVATANTGAGTLRGKSRHPTSPTGQGNTEVVGTTAGPSNPSPLSIDPNQSPAGIDQGVGQPSKKIIFYHMRAFNIGSCDEVLQYYLLMRAAMSLAQTYRKEIDEESEVNLTKHVHSSAQYYMWPAPQPSQKSDTSMRSIQTPSMGSPQPRDNYSIADYEDHCLHERPSHESNMQAIEVDDNSSLIFRQVEQLGSVYPDSKVRSYLLNSRPEIYEPLPEVQIDYD